MGDDRTAALPEGTDTVIQGAADDGDAGLASAQGAASDIGSQTPAPRADVELPAISGGTAGGSGTGGGSSSLTEQPTSGGTGGSQAGLADRFRSGREQLTSQAGDRARGFVTQGLERTSEALANVSRMVGDTAPGIEERLGSEYGDYARRAAGAIENVANSIAGKDPDELIDDTRTFVRSSPGVALAGAAVVGFVVARLIKSGLAPAGTDDA